MPAIDPITGVPILGTKSPAEQRAEVIVAVLDEKNALRTEDHDWIVVVTYALSNESANRAGVAEMEGVPANPPIPLMTELIAASTPVLCRKCEMPWVGVADKDCPGVSLREYLASLDDDTRAEVLRRLEETPDGEVNIEDDGTVTMVAEHPDGVVAMEFNGPVHHVTRLDGTVETLVEEPLPFASPAAPDIAGRDL